jgi:hypothetical protein
VNGPDAAGIRKLAKELERDPQDTLVMVEQANHGLELARKHAPKRTRHYERSLQVGVQDGKVVLGSDDVGAAAIEHGTSKNPPYAPLRSAVAEQGLRVEQG